MKALKMKKKIPGHMSDWENWQIGKQRAGSCGWCGKYPLSTADQSGDSFPESGNVRWELKVNRYWIVKVRAREFLFLAEVRKR